MEQFVFEVLVVFVESLALAHSDEKSLGTLLPLHPTLSYEMLFSLLGSWSILSILKHNCFKM